MTKFFFINYHHHYGYWFLISILFNLFCLSLMKSCVLCRKLYLKGLGYRFFIYQNMFYIIIGDSHYYCFNVLNLCFIFRQRQILFIFGVLVNVNRFIQRLQSLKKNNFYKGKGVFILINYKQLIKDGKKQQLT